MADILKAACIRRLLHDFKEVLERPLPFVTACPLDDDLYVWHGNGKQEW